MNTKEEAAKVGKTLSRYAITHDYSVYQAAEDGFIAGAKYALENQWNDINDRSVSMQNIPSERILLLLDDGDCIMYNDLERHTPFGLVTHWMETPKNKGEETR